MEEEWSRAANWQGGVAPSAGAEVGLLLFPALTGPTCTKEEEEHACYVSFDDLKGLSAESLVIEGDDYLIYGEALTLRHDGLSVSAPAEGDVPDFGILAMPFDLAAPQTWRFANRPGGRFDEFGVQIFGPINGPATSALRIELSNEAEPRLREGVEVGPLTIAGANPNEVSIFNGAYPLDGTDVNGEDGQPVNVEHVFLFGSGKVGQLTSDDAELTVGSAHDPAGGIEAASARLDSASGVEFPVTDSGTTVGQDYAQLTSSGAIELQSARIEVMVHPPEPGKQCPTLTRGQTYTFVSTTGTLSGTFANAPEGGAELPVEAAEGCAPSTQTLRIAYHESGSPQTVTGTVEEAAARTQEEEALKLAEEHGKQLAEEAAKRKQEEEAKLRVLPAKEVAPDATVAGVSLQASSSGAVRIRISCPAGVSSCAGTVTLRTLHAIAASAKDKASVLTLASGSFTVPGGAVRAITLHLSAKARALLARLHTLHTRVTIIAHDPAGGTHTGQSIVTLRAPKSRHGTR